MRYVCYSYDIPSGIPTGKYPEPATTLRCFAAHLQLSVWIVPQAMLLRTEKLTKRIKAVGGTVDEFDFDGQNHEKLLAKARQCMENDVARLR
jgi:hypothetical protein